MCYKTSPVVEAAYLRFSKFNHQYLKIKKRSSKCTQQPPFFFLSLFVIRTLNGYYKSVCLFFKSFFFHGNDLEPKGLCFPLSLNFCYEKREIFLSGKVPITKEEEKKKRNPVKLIVDLEREHRPIRP